MTTMPDAAAKFSPEAQYACIPLAGATLLAAQRLRHEARPGQMVECLDYRGVVNRVPGTDWLLVTKVDQSVTYRAAIRDSIWIGLAGLLVLFLAAGGQFLLRQRQPQVLERSQRLAEDERLRALRLLAAIADSSGDAIFAEDLEGRYRIFPIDGYPYDQSILFVLSIWPTPCTDSRQACF